MRSIVCPRDDVLLPGSVKNLSAQSLRGVKVGSGENCSIVGLIRVVT